MESAALLDGMLEGFAHCRMLYDELGRRDDFEYISVNPAFVRLTGLDDVVGRRVTTVLPGIKEENPELFDIYGAVAETGEPAEFDMDFRPLQKWLHVSATSPREGEFVALFYDITPRLLAEREAREASRRLSLSLAAAGAGVWEWDLVSGDNTWSDEVWSLYGLDRSAHEASFDAWLQSVLPQDRERLAGLVTSAAAKGRELDFEWRVATRDGSVRWLLSHGSPECHGDGRLVRYRGVVIDVTGRKQSEREVRESEARFRALFEHSSQAVFLTGPGGAIEAANTAAQEMFGYTEEEFRALGRAGVLDMSDPRVAPAVSELELCGRVQALELAAFRKGGVRFAVEVDSVIVKGPPEFRFVMMRDVTERQRVEDALRLSELEKRTALDAAGLGVWWNDLATGVVRLDDRGREHYGFDVAETTIDEVVARVHPDDVRRVAVEIAAATDPETGTGRFATEYRVLPPGKPMRWLSVAVRVLFEGEGHGRHATTALGTTADITERRRAEESLRESEQRHRELFEAMVQGVIYLDAQGRVIDANPAARRILGLSAEQLLRRTPLDTDWRTWDAAGVELPGPERPAAVALRTGRPVYGAEVGVFNPVDESVHWLSFDAVPQFLEGEDRPHRVFATFTDVTDRKLAGGALAAREAEAREMLERLSRAQALGHMGDWTWSMDTGEVTWSDEVYRIYGVDPAFDTSFESIVPMIHDEDREAHMRRVDAFARDPARTSTTFAFRIVRPDGEVRQITQTAIAERDAAGAVTRMYGVMQDVTELRRVEQALVKSEARLRRLNLELEDRVEQRTEDLRRANAELESFSYSVSHDLRAPLRHISGYSHLLAEQLGDGLDDEARHFLDVIVASAREMGQLIDDLLLLSRLGRTELRIGEVDMAACVREALGPLLDEEPGRLVAVRVGDLPVVRGDHSLLRQAWANLLSNALKYTRTCDAAEVEVGARAEADETVFYVRDNGVGFDMVYAGKLFTAFQRLHSSSEFEGTGIGLALVKRIVARHGGRVWADAAPGAGATFFFTVPRDAGGSR